MESNPDLTTVQPVRPVAPYIGGKRGLAKPLCELIAGVPHAIYAEPFVGMGGVFFRRSVRPRSEVINDISRDVTNLFRILQRHYPQFMEALKFQITSRADFERLLASAADTLTDLERAARFLYLQRTSFGGKVAGRSFGVSLVGSSRFDTTKLGPVLADVHERLAGVVIECLPWDQFITRYDRPDTLFYLDPPYMGGERDYGDGVFSTSDFARMADQLGRIKGSFILSINDRPQVRNIFAGFAMREVEVTYTVGGTDKAKRVGELIITQP